MMKEFKSIEGTLGPEKERPGVFFYGVLTVLEIQLEVG